MAPRAPLGRPIVVVMEVEKMEMVMALVLRLGNLVVMGGGGRGGLGRS